MIGFVLRNFAAPIAFFFLFRLSGPKPAIASAVGVSVLQLLWHWVRKLRISPFFIVASGFTVLFGLVDLSVTTPRFFRLEPFAENFLLGLFFGGSVVTGHALLLWFAESLPEKFKLVASPESESYLRKLTLVWSAYFFAKAFLFLYLAFQVSLDRLVVLRTLIGGISLNALFWGEIAYRKWFSGPGLRRSGRNG